MLLESKDRAYGHRTLDVNSFTSRRQPSSLAVSLPLGGGGGVGFPMPREGDGKGEEGFRTPTLGRGCCSTGWVEEEEEEEEEDEEEEERKNFWAAVSGLVGVSDRRRSVGCRMICSPPLLLLRFSLAVGMWVPLGDTCCPGPGPGPGPCAEARPGAGDGMRREGEDGLLVVIWLP